MSSSIPSSSSTGKPKPLPHLLKELQRVADTRPNAYLRTAAILVYWEVDDTNSKDDIATMGNMMTAFGIQSTVYKIPRTEHMTVWNLTHQVINMLKECDETDRNCLFIFYYVGHALKRDDELHFAPIAGDSRQSLIQWSRISSIFSDPYMNKIDVYAVLDCCYAASAMRSSSTKAFHIMAACDHDKSTAARGPSISFTQRMWRSLQHLSSSPHTTTTAIFEEIQREKPKNAPNAVFKCLSGVHPIKLWFHKFILSSPPSRIPRLKKPQNVLVKLTLKGDGFYTLPLFKQAIAELPDALSVEVSDAYETDASFFVLLRMTWETWCNWSMVIDLEMVGVIDGPSLVHRELGEIPIRRMDDNRKENRQAAATEKHK